MYQSPTSTLAAMFKLSIFAAVFLFWTILVTSLMRVELAAAPVRKAHIPTFRSMPIKGAAIAQVQAMSTVISYN